MTKRREMPQPEFARPVDVARVRKLGWRDKLVATADECRAVAQRLRVPAVHALSADVQVKPWRGGGYKVEGQATIDLDQVSVISLETFRTQQTVEITRYFLDAPQTDDGEIDIEPIVNGIIDVGEIVVETMALELDAYPRKPGEVFVSPLEDELRLQAENVSPFKAVLRDKREN